MTRLIVLSDVHGNSVALAAVRKAIRTEKPDLVAVAGDLVLNGPDPVGAEGCSGYVTVENGKFVPQFKTTAESPFICFSVNPYPATLTNPKYSNGDSSK